MKNARTIGEYLKRVSPDQRAALQKLRRAIKAAIPGAEEIISYQMPAFRLDGRVLVWFGAGANHCAFYPGAYPIAAHKGKLIKYKTSTGALRFHASHPLPPPLVRTLC